MSVNQIDVNAVNERTRKARKTKEVRKNILLERAYDLVTYTALIVMGLGVAIVVLELVI